MNILQINTCDEGGGAERIASDLNRIYQTKGYTANLMVGRKRTNNPGVIQFPVKLDLWQRLCFAAGHRLMKLAGSVRGAGWMSQRFFEIGQPKKTWATQHGHEDFEFPNSWHLLDLLTENPDIIHCHNLHGGYFDLRYLSQLSNKTPIIITLHDAWLLSGHCAHSFACERWKTGCGQCPDLKIPPGILKDATNYNWRLKERIYKTSCIYLATPCNWLMQKVKQSILAPSIIKSRIIPNGVDLSIFHPADMQSVRKELGISQNSTVILFVANGFRQNIWKDSQTLMSAIELVAERCVNHKILFIAVGENAHVEKIGKAEILFVPYQKDSAVVATYYQAADIYIHAAKADTFPTTILEALACGTPVVATSVGGIPEQVRSLHTSTIEDTGNRARWSMGNCILSEFPSYTVKEATGVLVPPGDAVAMAGAIEILMKDEALRKRLSANAAKDACQRFDFERCANDYLTWYQEIIG